LRRVNNKRTESHGTRIDARCVDIMRIPDVPILAVPEEARARV